MVELVEYPLNPVAYIIAAKQLTWTFLYVLNSHRPYLIPGILGNLILLKQNASKKKTLQFLEYSQKLQWQ